MTCRHGALFLLLAVPSTAIAGRAPDDVPDELAVDDDEKLTFAVHAIGVQIYDCKVSAGAYSWVFREPDAVLYDADGEEVGVHYAGPTWESDGGSAVVGARVAGVSSPDGAISWLLLEAVDHDGPGLFQKVTSIQRLHTVGGVAPSTGCDAGTVGTDIEVDYEADYYFYKLHDAS